MGDVTKLLGQWNRGDAEAFEALMPLVYAELRRLADHYMAHEQQGHTLQPTALVHEAYIRLTNVRQGRFQNRVHFYGAAAQAMRRILVDSARQRQAVKRGQNATMLNIDAMPELGIEIDDNIVALDDALNRLVQIAPRAAEVVQLRYFGGLSIDEVAEVLDISAATVKRHWAFARAWLYRALAAPTT
jgi:RNA polymerase sigma-70 factor (ECF subfamily)